MKHIILTLFVFISISILQAENIENKNILIVHSYHQGQDWTNNISRGIENVLLDHPNYQLFYEYLDTKRNTSSDYLQKLHQLFKMKVDNMSFSAIIASDNAAYNFLLEYADQMKLSIPIVFCGINNIESLVHNLPDNFYILGEQVDHQGTLSLISSLIPEVDNIFIINDNTLTGEMIQQEVEDIIPQFQERFQFQFINTFSVRELEYKVRNLPQNSVIYLLVVNEDRTGEFITYRRGIEIVKRNANVPIFGSWDFYLNRGIVGGMITSGVKQGEEASKILINILENENADTIPHVSYIDNIGIVDYNKLTQFSLKIDNVPDNYKIINRPDKKSYQNAFYISIFFLFLVLFFSLLFFYQRRNTKIRLEKMVEEKTQELQSIITKKDKFLSLIAHDLRSPTGSISEGLNFLNNSGDKMTPAKRANFSKELAKSAHKVYTLVEDLLLWGRVQLSKEIAINYETIRLKKMTAETCELYYNNRDRSLFINNIDDDYILYSDAFITKFILRNLISNALKFSDNNSPITIGAGFTKEYYRLWVKDDGNGMSREVLQSIIDKKPIQNAGNNGQESFGLGLNTIFQYLEYLNGDLTIDSQLGYGSTFYIYLPRKAE